MNSKIKIGGNSVFYRSWFEKGIHTVKDMLDSFGRIYSYETFTEIFDINVPFTTFGGIKTLLLTKFPSLRENDYKEIGPNQPKFVEIIVRIRKDPNQYMIFFLIIWNLKIKLK